MIVLSSVENQELAPPASASAMRDVVGVRFRRSRRLHYCDARGHKPRIGDYVIVQTAAGPELARVTMGCTRASPEMQTHGRHVVRPASRHDLESMRRLAPVEADARIDFFKAAAAEGVFVSAVRADFRFDGSALRFKFHSERPVGETTLRRRLAGQFGAGIELRNLGAPKKTREGTGCGGGSCSSCPSNGLRERAGALMPRAGRAKPGAFARALAPPLRAPSLAGGKVS